MSHKIIATPTSKLCPQCGRTLPSEAFGKRYGGVLLRSYCRECSNRLGRTKYKVSRARYVKGDVLRKEDGTLWEYTRAHWRRHWSPQMLHDLRKYYPTTTNEELAGLLGVPYGTLNRKARELGLRKSPQFIADISSQHLALARAESKIHGNAGQFKPGEHRGRETEFKRKDSTPPPT